MYIRNPFYMPIPPVTPVNPSPRICALRRQAGEGAARRLGRGVGLGRLAGGGRRHGRGHWVGPAAEEDEPGMLNARCLYLFIWVFL